VYASWRPELIAFILRLYIFIQDPFFIVILRLFFVILRAKPEGSPHTANAA
jgi:hypothetical protein